MVVRSYAQLDVTRIVNAVVHGDRLANGPTLIGHADPHGTSCGGYEFNGRLGCANMAAADYLALDDLSGRGIVVCGKTLVAGKRVPGKTRQYHEEYCCKKYLSAPMTRLLCRLAGSRALMSRLPLVRQRRK